MQAFEELNGYYLKKLQLLPRAAADGQEKTPGVQCMACKSQEMDCHEKIAVLESYVDTLKEQNRTLIEVVEELETEAEQRVHVMEELLERTADATKAFMVTLRDGEQIFHTLTEKGKALTVIRRLRDTCSRLEAQNRHHRDRASSLACQVRSLVRLINHARSTGQWEEVDDDVDFGEVSLEQVFGEQNRYDSRSPSSSPDGKCVVGPGSFAGNVPLADVGLLTARSDLTGTSDCTDSTLGTLMPSVDDIHANPERQSLQLHFRLEELSKQQASLQLQLCQRDRMISELQAQISEANHDMSIRESNCFAHVEMIRKLRENSRMLAWQPLPSTAFPCDTTGASEERSSKVDLQNGVGDESRSHCCVLQAVVYDDREKAETDSTIVDQRLEDASASNVASESFENDHRGPRINDEEDYDSRVARTDKEVQTDGDSDSSGSPESRRRGNGSDATGSEFARRESELLAEVEELRRRDRERSEEMSVMRSEIENLEKVRVEKETEINNNSRMVEMNQQITDYKNELHVTLKVLEARNAEIDNQKRTICNLQDALVALKRTSSNVAPPPPPSVNGKAELSNGSRSSSGEVFDV